MVWKDKTKKAEYQRERVRSRRLEYATKLGGKCAKCGSTNQLEFDHIDPLTKISPKIWSWSIERIEAEILKCQLLCRSCHEQKSVEERNYPERKHGTNLRYNKDKCRCAECKAAHAEVNYALRRTPGRKRSYNPMKST